MVSSVVIDCVPWNGYTTCMWHNLITSKIVLDKNCKLNALQEKYRIPYPKKLKENKEICKIYALPGNGGIAADATLKEKVAGCSRKVITCCLKHTERRYDYD